MTVVNFITSVILLIYGIYLVLRCRKEVRGMMFVFAVAGLWAFTVHSLVMWDKVVDDFMEWQLVTDYLIRPLLFVLMCTVLAAMIRMGWRYDR